MKPWVDGLLADAATLDAFAEWIRGGAVRLAERADSWEFACANEVILRVNCLWRLRAPDQVLLTSGEHGHQYGLPAPIDAVADFKSATASATASEIAFDMNTGDLRIAFDNGLKLEVVVDSSGYECWSASRGYANIIGRGDGVLNCGSAE